MEDRFAREMILSPLNSDSDDSDYSPPNLRKSRKNNGETDTTNSRPSLKTPSRPKSTSFLALKDAVYQLTCLNDFSREKIGYGFFADVYKVTHKTTGEVMVLKMNKCRKNSRSMLAEIQLMNRLSHPNILVFKGSCVHEGQLHALTEYVNGGNLEELLLDSSSGHLSWSTKIKLAHDIASGMAYLHSREVFHRDLTSKNCLIHKSNDGSMRCVVADFGLAAKIKHKRHSYTGSVGSPFWMAPECLEGKEYGEQSDVFSYGIVLAEIISQLSADPDFLPRTKRYGVDYDKLREYCEGCPSVLWDIMYRCSQLDPDDRPTFDEIVTLLTPHLTPPTSCSLTNTSDDPPSPRKSLFSTRSQSEPIIAPCLNKTKSADRDSVYQESSSPLSSSSSHQQQQNDDDFLSSQLSSLLEGSTETDGIPQRKISLISQDSGCVQERSCDSGIDPDVFWRNLALAKTPSLGDSATPLTPAHLRQTSNSSDISFQLPSPSFAWAPPSSPCRSLISPVNVFAAGTCDGSLSSPERSPEFVRHSSTPPLHRPLSNPMGVASVGVVSDIHLTLSDRTDLNELYHHQSGEQFNNHKYHSMTTDVSMCS